METDQLPLPNELPIVCTLSNEERAQRGDTLGDLFGSATRVEELPDGRLFHYPGTEEWARRLLDFVVFERRCCRFFTFELHFEPNEGPIRFHVRGPEGVKDMLKRPDMLADSSPRLSS